MFRRAIGQRVLIHAGLTMSSADYEFAVELLRERHRVTCPPADALDRGGFVGEVTVTAIVPSHPSRWFRGPMALVLADAKVLPFVPAKGRLGLWTVKD
jgi:hypothetical protein